MEIIRRDVKPAELRALIRAGRFDQPTPGYAPGHAQANLVILPERYAFEFLLFCQRNPRPCPILEVLEPGRFEPEHLAPGADVRADLPKYRVWREGRLAGEVTDVRELFTADMVTFLIGCSFSFEEALVEAGLPVRHIDENRNVPMYLTNRPCRPAGRFSGPLVVSMRPYRPEQIPAAVAVTGRYPAVHGAPLFVGGAAELGIKDIDRPDFGDPVTIHPGEVPVFWACGVTSSMAALAVKAPLAITHAPGHMFVTDRLNREYAVL